jgi:hypothetical protein
VDLLIPAGQGYRLVEVKSSTSVKEYHLPDVAVQEWVLTNNGLNIVSKELAHINNQFIYPGNMEYNGLFHYQDVGDMVDALAPQVPLWVQDARKVLAEDEPAIDTGKQCNDPFECPFLSYCSPPQNASDLYPPEDLPRASRLAEALRSEGYEDLRDIPPERLERAQHQRIHRAVLSGKPLLDQTAYRVISDLPYPRYYVDFETISFAVPIWRGTRPYQQLPFQWSCHVEPENGELAHVDYLAEGPHDPRREFAEQLLHAVGDEGPIVVYNAAFERTRMRELATAYPDLAERLEAAISRIFDLLPVARDYYYHPDMHGSWSIKAVLPTIAPDLDYAELEVADGGMAQDAYLRLYHSNIDKSEQKILRKALLRYCELDTLAMVKIAHYFQHRDVDAS